MYMKNQGISKPISYHRVQYPPRLFPLPLSSISLQQKAEIWTFQHLRRCKIRLRLNIIRKRLLSSACTNFLFLLSNPSPTPSPRCLYLPNQRHGGVFVGIKKGVCQNSLTHFFGSGCCHYFVRYRQLNHLIIT